MADFHFMPLRKKRKIETELYVNIYKPGIVHINKFVALNLGFDPEKGAFVTLYEDLEKRALGFRIDKQYNGTTKPKGMRYVKPTPVKNGNDFFMLSLSGFLKQLPNVKFPSGRLKVQQYQDSFIGKLWYFKIPNGEKAADTEEQG